MSNDNEIVGRRSRLIFETIKPRLTAIIINLTDRASEAYVRYWHKADMSRPPVDVCFRENSGHCAMSLPQKWTSAERIVMSAKCQ